MKAIPITITALNIVLGIISLRLIAANRPEAVLFIIPISDDEDNTQWTHRWRAVSVNMTGRVKVWRYDASVQDCTNSQGPWR